MSHTLHLCHLTDSWKQQDLLSHLALINKGDQVVFYGQRIDAQRLQAVIEAFSSVVHHFIFSEDTIHSSICYDEWIDLVDQFDKTFGWKSP